MVDKVPKLLSKQKSLVIVCAAVLTLIVTAIGATTLMDRNDAPSVSSAPPESGPSAPPDSLPAPSFDDYLKPSSTIVIGENRYKSPCQLLSGDTVTEIYGPFTDETIVQETYFDKSSEDSYVRGPASCSYVFGGSSGGTVGLVVEHVASREYNFAANIGADDERIEEALARYQTAVDASRNDDAKQMLETLKTSSAAYQTFMEGYLGGEVVTENEPTDGWILPGGLLGTSDFEFVGTQGTTIYRLDHTLTGIVSSDSVHTDSEVIDALVRTKRAYEEIFKNDKNSELSQSPGPTIIGKSDQYGGTAIVEPCAVLSDAVFARIVGSISSGPISRQSVPYDMSEKRLRDDGSVILPSNECAREFTADEANDDRVKIDIEYSESLAAAEAYIAREFVRGEGDIALETQADWATLYTFDPESRSVVFREGPYMVTVSVSHVFHEGLEFDIITTDADQAQYVVAVNEIVSSLDSFLQTK